MAKFIVTHGIRIAIGTSVESANGCIPIGVPFKVGRRTRIVATCKCGEIYVAYVSRDAISGTCGCALRQSLQERNCTHGASKNPAYKCWRSMLERCHNPKAPNYAAYGGRGIHVCDRWREPNGQGFFNFLADIGIRPSTKHSIDRSDNAGGYTPENCRWATPKEQAKNRRTTRFYADAVLREHAESLNTVEETLRGRLRRGWNINAAISQPIKRYARRHTIYTFDGFEGTVSEWAEHLGLSYAGAYAWLHRHGIA